MTLLVPTSGAGRLLRGAATGALAVVAHVEGDGSPPSTDWSWRCWWSRALAVDVLLGVRASRGPTGTG